MSGHDENENVALMILASSEKANFIVSANLFYSKVRSKIVECVPPVFETTIKTTIESIRYFSHFIFQSLLITCSAFYK